MSIKEKLELVCEALKDYDDGELSDLSTLVAIQLLVNECKPSDEAMEWAKNSIIENYM